MDGDAVLLDRGDHWERIPPDIRHRIEEGAVRIRAIREAISPDARVRYMPPVTVDPAAWSPDGGKRLIHAMAGAWRNLNDGHVIGVLASAGPALCDEEATVRAVLVHEFAHCFKIATIVVDHNDLGTSLDLLSGDPADPKREHLMLAEPRDWFGAADIELLHWGDERMQPVTDEVKRLVIAGHLPGTQPPLVEPASFSVPGEWKEHIRRIRRPS